MYTCIFWLLRKHHDAFKIMLKTDQMRERMKILHKHFWSPCTCKQCLIVCVAWSVLQRWLFCFSFPPHLFCAPQSFPFLPPEVWPPPYPISSLTWTWQTSTLSSPQRMTSQSIFTPRQPFKTSLVIILCPPPRRMKMGTWIHFIHAVDKLPTDVDCKSSPFC